MDAGETGKGRRGSSFARLPGRAVEVYRTQGAAILLRSTIRFAQRLLLGRVYAFLLQRVELELADCPATLIAGCLYRVTLRIRKFRLPLPSWSTTLLIRYAFSGANGQAEGGEMLPLGPRQPSGRRDFELGALVDTPGRPGDYDLTIGFAVDAPFASFYVPLTRQIRVAAHEDALMASAMPALDVTMDVTNRCNLRCVQCRKTHTERPADQHDIDRALFEKIAREVFPHTRMLMLSSAGEPLMAKFFWEALETALGSGAQEVGFTSNGLLLDPRRAERIVDMGVGRVEFSVDGATRDVYERIRAGSSYDRVTGNIRHLAQYKKIRGARIPILRLNVVLMRSNIHQLPDLVDLAADLGVEELLCQHMIVFADLLRDESLVLEKQRSNDYVRAAAERATERQIRFYHPPLFDLPHQVLPAAVPAAALAARSEADVIYAAAGDYNFQRKANDETGPKAARCTDPWRKVAFDWQGLVFPCCAWKGQPIGDISKTSFAEIWNSPEYRQLRRGLTRGPVPGPCLQCSAISGGNVNQESAFLFG